MKRTRRSGFTLVELLIVIVVIGVLSAMMMLSSTEAVSSAKASNIVSNLRNLKTAATAMFVDYQDYSLTNGVIGDEAGSMDIVIKYLNNASGVTTATNSEFKDYGIINKDDGWYVYLRNVDTNLQPKLAGRASSVGLTGGSDTDALKKGTAYTGGTIVGMWVVKP